MDGIISISSTASLFIQHFLTMDQFPIPFLYPLHPGSQPLTPKQVDIPLTFLKERKKRKKRKKNLKNNLTSSSSEGGLSDTLPPSPVRPTSQVHRFQLG